MEHSHLRADLAGRRRRPPGERQVLLEEKDARAGALPGTQEERTLRLRRRQTSPSAARPSSSSRPVTPEFWRLALAAWRPCHRNPIARARAAADCVTDETRAVCEREAPHVRAPPRSVGNTSAQWHGAGFSSGQQTKNFLEQLSQHQDKSKGKLAGGDGDHGAAGAQARAVNRAERKSRLKRSHGSVAVDHVRANRRQRRTETDPLNPQTPVAIFSRSQQLS